MASFLFSRAQMTKGNPNLALYWSFSWHILAFSSADNWSKWAWACSAWLSWVSCPAWANLPARSGWTRRIPSLTKWTKKWTWKMLYYSTGWGYLITEDLEQYLLISSASLRRTGKADISTRPQPEQDNVQQHYQFGLWNLRNSRRSTRKLSTCFFFENEFRFRKSCCQLFTQER